MKRTLSNGPVTAKEKQPRRKSQRLAHFDYSQPGAYFVTLVTQGRLLLFGSIHEGIMHSSEAGKAVQSVWDNLKNHYPHVEPDVFVIMPNHFHAIIRIIDDDLCEPDTGNTVSLGESGECSAQKPRHGISEIVRALKTFSARKINKLLENPGARIWQRGFYDHIIRDEDSLNNIREYIINNPLQWELDQENPNARSASGVCGE